MSLGNLMKQLSVESSTFTQTNADVQDVSSDLGKVLAADINGELPTEDDKSTAELLQLEETATSLESSRKHILDMQAANKVMSPAVFKSWHTQVTSSFESNFIPVNVYELDLISVMESFENSELEDYSGEALNMLDNTLVKVKERMSVLSGK